MNEDEAFFGVEERYVEKVRLVLAKYKVEIHIALSDGSADVPRLQRLLKLQEMELAEASLRRDIEMTHLRWGYGRLSGIDVADNTED